MSEATKEGGLREKGRFRLGARLVQVIGFAIFSMGLAFAAPAAEDDKIIFPGTKPQANAPAAGPSQSANSITLVIALALAGAGAWMFWRNRRGVGVGREAKHLAIEETRPLGNRQYLVVASYEGKKFLLGVCPGRIDMLTPLSDQLRREGEG